MTKKINEIMSSYILRHKDEDERLVELSKFVEAFFTDLGDDFSDIKEIFAESLCDYTYEISEEEVEEAVKKLMRKDGVISGIKWTKAEIESISKQYSIKDKFSELGCSYNELYFWAAMNYVYATHFNTNRSIVGYIELAIDEMCNKNVGFDLILKGLSK